MTEALYSRDEAAHTTTFWGYTITDEYRDRMQAMGCNPWEGHPLQQMLDARR